MTLIFALAMCGIMPGGCAVKSPPVTLSTGAPSTPSSETTIGVILFDDRRPDEQRRSKKPKLIPLLVWNQRIGDYTTGSGSFTDEISEAVTKAVVASISERDTEATRLLDESSVKSKQSLTDYCEATGLRWIVSGSIDDLYATLHQKSYFFIIPTPWAAAAGWDNETTDPLGVARFTVQVFDCKMGAGVLDREFSAERHYANATLAEGAKRAMNEALKPLADSVHLVVLGRTVPGGPPRVPERTDTGLLADVTEVEKELVEGKPGGKELARVDLDLVPVTIKHDSRFPNDFGIAIMIDDHEGVFLDSDSETTKKLSRGEHLVRIVDPKKGFFHKPDWADYEFTLKLENLPNQRILIESRGLFRISLHIKIYSEGNEVARYKIKASR